MTIHDHLRGPRPSEELEVACWCEAETKVLPAADVRRGVTWSCGIGCSRVSAARRAEARRAARKTKAA